MAGNHEQPPNQFRPGWLDSLDGRYKLAGELRARFDEVCADLGGVNHLSYMQRSLIERGLWLEYWLAQQEKALAKGGDFDIGKWVQASNSLQGIFGRLGLERKARQVPDLHAYQQRHSEA